MIQLLNKDKNAQVSDTTEDDKRVSAGIIKNLTYKNISGDGIFSEKVSVYCHIFFF